MKKNEYHSVFSFYVTGSLISYLFKGYTLKILQMPPVISGGLVLRTLKIPESKDAQAPGWAHHNQGCQIHGHGGPTVLNLCFIDEDTSSEG